MPTIHTYYYGVLCVACHGFIRISEYQTVHMRGIVDVTLGVAVRCPHCEDACTYLSDRVVFSRSADKMVPLA